MKSKFSAGFLKSALNAVFKTGSEKASNTPVAASEWEKNFMGAVVERRKLFPRDTIYWARDSSGKPVVPAEPIAVVHGSAEVDVRSPLIKPFVAKPSAPKGESHKSAAKMRP
jgi:hypothetical protein